MKKKNPACIRGIKQFEKTGCPQKAWDGESGCIAWVVHDYDNEDPTKPAIKVEACLDMIQFDVQLKMLRFLEGQQIAIESLRNGLCETRDGKTEPKPDPMIEHLICTISTLSNQRLIQGN